MARNERLIHADPSAVFGVLADPRSYAYWVVGSKQIRAADRRWPDPGSRFHHTIGLGPVSIRDQTAVEEMTLGRYLQLYASMGPLGAVRVSVELSDAPGGTRVVIVEDPAEPASAPLATPMMQLTVKARNALSLKRLAELAEGRRPIPGEEPGAPVRQLAGAGAVQNPLRLQRDRWGRTGVRAVGGGLAAAAVGGLVIAALRSRG